MNIKISKEEHEFLLNYLVNQFTFGSRMYGTDTENSDTDYLCIYKFPTTGAWGKVLDYPSIHQFQYDDIENNAQYIWTSIYQFNQNLTSGDSIVNAEVLLFDDNISTIYSKLELLRTYKIIKAFLGFAKRDLKNNKLFHAERCLYIAYCLLDNELPTLNVIREMKNGSIIYTLQALINLERELRERCNKLFEKGELQMYFIPKVENPLLQKLLDSNNTKEFKY